MIIEKVKLFAQKYDMLPEGERVLCAVSGGADSVCLLHLLLEMGVDTVCAHFNHCLRGAESDADEEFVRSLCAEKGIEFVSARGDVAKYAAENSMGIEEAARTLRYDFLRSAAEELGCGRIATAHNGGDNAETVLFNLARGSGLKGLCGIPPVRGIVVRPILCLDRAEIEAYLQEKNAGFVFDSSNALDDYSRNRIRHHVLPALLNENSGAVENIFSACESLREDEEFLSSLAKEFIKENLRKNRLPVQKLLALPRPVVMRVFRMMCGRSLSRAHAQSLYALCLNRALLSHADVPGMRVTKDGDGLFFGRAPLAEPLPETELLPGKTVSIPEAGLEIICSSVSEKEEIHKSFNTFYLKSENICGKLLLSSRREGDKLRAEGRSCTKSLRKLYSEAGFTAEKRILNPVIRDDMGVAAAYGFGTAERCAGKKGDKLIKIEIREKKEEEHSHVQSNER